MKNKTILFLFLFLSNITYTQERFINKSIEFLSLANSKKEKSEIRKLTDNSLDINYFNNELDKFINHYKNYSKKINFETRHFMLSDSLIVDILITSEQKENELGILRFLFKNDDNLIDNFVFLETKIEKKEEEQTIETLPPRVN